MKVHTNNFVMLHVSTSDFNDITALRDRLNKCDDMKWCRVTHEVWEFGDNFYLYYDPYYNSFYIGTYIGDKNGSDFITDSIKIEYVHELQHALRLCGIEKEIIL